MKTLYIYGAGDEGKNAVDLALDSAPERKIYFIDDTPQENRVLGIPVCTLREVIESADRENSEFLVTVGEPYIRKKLYQKLKEQGFHGSVLLYPNFVHCAEISIAEGTIVHHGTIIHHGSKIGENCLLGTGIKIGHDVEVGEDSVISPGTVIGGHTKVGKDVYIGSGAVIRNGIRIGNNCIIGMGSVVTKSVEDNMVMVGNPARFLRENTNKRVFKN